MGFISSFFFRISEKNEPFAKMARRAVRGTLHQFNIYQNFKENFLSSEWVNSRFDTGK